MNIKKLAYAVMMADEMWDKYMKSPEPSQRRIYALKYEFWAGTRDYLLGKSPKKPSIKEET